MRSKIYYRNINLINIKNRTLGLFEIYLSKKDMENENIYGYSVRFKTHSVKLRNFRTWFREVEGKDWDMEDKNYGVKFWDFTTKSSALNHIENLKT